MTSPRFTRHRSAVKWESGAFNLPNKLVQDKNLTDSGFRLLAWMVSCSPDWDIYQTDIRKRFEWGREKTEAAIANLIDCKYLFKFPQRMLENGRYGPCDYQFESQGFTDEEIKDFQIKFPMSGESTSVDSASIEPTSKQILIPTTPNLKDGVCKREDAPLTNSDLSDDKKKPERINGSLVMRITIKPPRSDPYEFAKEEIYRIANGEYARLKWTAAEIAEAWESLVNSKAPIVDPIEYIDKTISMIRIHLKKKQKAEYIKRKELKQNTLEDSQCQAQLSTTETNSKLESLSCRKSIAERDSSEKISPSLRKLLPLKMQ